MLAKKRRRICGAEINRMGSKNSLHKSGHCHLAFTKQLASHEPPFPDNNRKICEWTRDTDLSGVRHSQAALIRFTPISHGTTAAVQLSGKAVQLPYPPLNACLEVAVFFSETNPLSWKDSRWPTKNIIGGWQIDAKEYVAVRRRVVPISAQEWTDVNQRCASTSRKAVLGESDPSQHPPGVYDAMLAKSTPHCGQVDVLLAVPVGLSDQTIVWTTRTGQRYRNEN